MADSGNKIRKEDREEVRRVWNANAEFWDSSMGEGNEFHKKLILPVLEKLLSIEGGENILDLACGNGQLSRWMAGKGATVHGVDISENLVSIARRKSEMYRDSISYSVLDITEPEDLEKLEGREYDSIVCNMAVMDTPEIAPLAHSVSHLLKSGGKFVMSTTHPCFNTADMKKVAIESEEGGVLKETIGIHTDRYLTPRKIFGLAIRGQPEAQPYFERPLNMILRPFLEHGLLLNSLEEPSFTDSEQDEKGEWHSWRRYSEIPPVLIVSFIRP